MSKYIIELDDRIKLVTSVGVTENGAVYATSDYVHNLEELNSDYINEHYGELQDEAYQAGLNDMWDVVRKISLMTSAEAEEVFAGAGSYNRYNLGYSGVEAMDAYKAYLEKKDRIEVGDEVISDTGNKFTVTGFANSDDVCGFSERGLWCFNTIDKLTKTGKHYDIASILEAMKS